MDEKKFLENFAKILGSSAQEELKKIEEKKLKEERLLKSFGAALSKSADFEIKIEEEIQPSKQIKLPDEFIKKAPQIIVKTPIVHIETITEPVVEEVVVEPPVLEVANLVSQAVSATNVPEDGKKTEADLINASLRKEIEVIKKSVADFHKLVNEQSRKIALAGSSHGGGEVNLRYLDDIDRSSIRQGHFLTYDNSTKKFIFSQIAEGNVDLSHIDQQLTPGANGVYNLGSPTDYWANVYADSLILDGGGIEANGSFGNNGQVLTSNGSSIYWNTLTPDRLVANGYEVILATTGQLNLPSANNTESKNARIQSSANIDILSASSLWTFGTDSVLTLPEHGKIIFNSANPEQYIEGTMGFHIHASDSIQIEVGANSSWNFTNDGILSIPGNIMPQANTVYSLGNSSMRWESLWVGGNSVTFSDQNVTYPDQTLTVANGIFYITDSLDTKQQSNAGLRVGNFLLQNNYISLTNSESTFYIGTTLATGNLVINRPVVMNSPDTGAETFAVTRNGRVSIHTPNIPAYDVGALNIIGSSDGSYQGVTNPGGMIHITGNDNTATRFTIDSFGANGIPAIVGRRARGTAATPSNSQTNDILLRISAVGWTGGANFTLPTSTVAATAIEAQAIENYTDSSVGSQWKIYNAPQGSVVKTLSATINTNGISTNSLSTNVVISTANVTTNTLYANTINTNNLIATINISTNSVYSNSINTNTVIATSNLITNTVYANSINTNTLIATVNVTTNNVYANNIISYSNISGNSATFSSNVYIGNAGVATKLVISGGANDQILVSNGTTLNWTPRHTDGSWTPVMIPATGSNVVFTVNNGKYVKVGPIVTAHFDIVVSSKGTAAGDLKLGGLPFTSLAGSAGNYEGTISMGYFANLNVTDAIHFSGAVIQNSNTADVWLSTLNGQHIAQSPLNTTDVKITSRFVGTVIYTADF
jgi:hypothetical protein